VNPLKEGFYSPQGGSGGGGGEEEDKVDIRLPTETIEFMNPPIIPFIINRNATAFYR